MDAVGNLINVFEQNPAGGADWVTTYTYDALGHVISVSMPRSNGTQTRTFVYSGADLIPATNPENGTVTYQYDAAHHVTTRTDALGQQTTYTYDSYGRLTEVQHWAWVQHNVYGQGPYNSLDEQGAQRVYYTYDGHATPSDVNPVDQSYPIHNPWGRLTAVQFSDESTGGSYSYQYSYNQAGRVTAQHMDYDRGTGNAVNFDAAYTWDQEGRMTSINYGPQYTLTYDANGRLGGMSGNDLTMTASYGVAGQLAGLNYQGSYGQDVDGETRTYNNLLQMTRLSVAGTSFSQAFTQQTVLDMNYVYTAGANNGRITSSVDNVSNETVSYTYDTLNRLTAASASGKAWSQTYSYDGFGNLTGKSAVGAYPALNVTYNPATNSAGGNDANGNPTGVGYTFDVENRMITGAGNGYAYDPAGKRVKKACGNAWEFYFYGVGGAEAGDAGVRDGGQRAGVSGGDAVQRIFRWETGKEQGAGGNGGPVGERAGERERGADELLPVWGGADEHGGRSGEVRDVHAG
jgi:YD repeat-containing protein